MLEHILLKAYADTIVEVINERNDSDWASVSIGDENPDSDRQVIEWSAKFYWTAFGDNPFDQSYETTLQLNVQTGEVKIDDLPWWPLNRGTAEIAVSAIWSRVF